MPKGQTSSIQIPIFPSQHEASSVAETSLRIRPEMGFQLQPLSPHSAASQEPCKPREVCTAGGPL